MKSSLVVVLMSISASSFAISTPKLVEACRKVGVEKVVRQAESLGLKVNPKEVKECGVDNRPLNVFAKYVWFCATTTGGEKEISVKTQKPTFQKCF